MMMKGKNMKSIEEYFVLIDPDRRKHLENFHNKNISLINSAKGSKFNHQSWKGGYRNHLEQCLFIAEHLYKIDVGSINFDSIFMVLYFHDIEKVFNHVFEKVFHYEMDKDDFLRNSLPTFWKIKLTDEELMAIKYIHGEGDDYRKDARVMNKLSAFCHACDVFSARITFDKKEMGFR